MNTDEAAVLRHVPVGAGQAQAPVGPPRAGGPDLRAVEDPLVAVAHGGGSAPATSEPPLGSERNCIHSSSPLRIAGRWRRFCSSVPNSSSTAAHGDERRRLEADGILVARQLLVAAPSGGPGSGPGRRTRGGSRCRRGRRRRACAAARGSRSTSASSSSSVNRGRRYPTWSDGVLGRQVGPDPGPGAGPEVVDGLRLAATMPRRIGHDATSMVSTLPFPPRLPLDQVGEPPAVSAGVPKAARLTTMRRR